VWFVRSNEFGELSDDKLICFRMLAGYQMFSGMRVREVHDTILRYARTQYRPKS